jgi:hypothetical protein
MRLTALDYVSALCRRRHFSHFCSLRAFFLLFTSTKWYAGRTALRR